MIKNKWLTYKKYFTRKRNTKRQQTVNNELMNIIKPLKNTKEWM